MGSSQQKFLFSNKRLNSVVLQVFILSRSQPIKFLVFQGMQINETHNYGKRYHCSTGIVEVLSGRVCRHTSPSFSRSRTEHREIYLYLQGPSRFRVKGNVTGLKQSIRKKLTDTRLVTLQALTESSTCGCNPSSITACDQRLCTCFDPKTIFPPSTSYTDNPSVGYPSWLRTLLLSLTDGQTYFDCDSYRLTALSFLDPEITVLLDDLVWFVFWTR